MQLVGDFYIPDGDHHFVELGAQLEHYQEPQRLKAFEFVTDWSRAVDLGAHIGIFSRHFAQLFTEVIAFEPTPETRACLEKNVPSNVVIIPYACGDREDNVKFRRHIKNSGGSEVIFSEGSNAIAEGSKLRFEEYTARMITLDSLSLDTLGLIKIDIQGCEPLALRGARETLLRCKPVVLIEEKPLGGPKGSIEHIETSRSLLEGYGYRQGEKVGADRIYLCG